MRPLNLLLHANAPEYWLGFAVHAFLKFMLPPGLSPEVALMWARHVVDAALLVPQAARASARAA